MASSATPTTLNTAAAVPSAPFSAASSDATKSPASSVVSEPAGSNTNNKNNNNNNIINIKPATQPDFTAREKDDCRAFEKWLQWLLTERYNISDVDPVEDFLLYCFLRKSALIETWYADYAPSTLESYREEEFLKELAEELEIIKSEVEESEDFKKNAVDDEGEETASIDQKQGGSSRSLATKSIYDKLKFPDDQVSEGLLLGYILEIVANVEKGTIVNNLKSNVAYHIQKVQNWKVILDEFKVLDVGTGKVSAEGLLGLFVLCACLLC